MKRFEELPKRNYFNPYSSIKPTNRGNFHSGELLRCRRIFFHEQ